MRMSTRRVAFQLVVVASTVFLVLLLVLQHDSSGYASWLQDLGDDQTQGMGVGVVRGAFINMGFQIGTPLPIPSGRLAVPTESHCPPGFYSKEELKPPLERPSQDPAGPGAYGQAFVKGRLTPAEQKEKQDGLKKNCFNQFASDRISLHRSLGNDTRHPEFHGINERISKKNYEELVVFYFNLIQNCDIKKLPSPHGTDHEL